MLIKSKNSKVEDQSLVLLIKVVLIVMVAFSMFVTIKTTYDHSVELIKLSDRIDTLEMQIYKLKLKELDIKKENKDGNERINKRVKQ